jgi:hypothetical protein
MLFSPPSPSRRHLKHVYFTVLDRFTRPQLEAQRAALQGLEDRLKRAPLTKRMQRQQAALCGQLGSEGAAVVRLSNGVGGELVGTEGSVGVGEGAGVGVGEGGGAVAGCGVEAAVGVTSMTGVVGAARESKNARGKNQRSSLRKQRLRVEDRLRRLAQGQEVGQGQGEEQRQTQEYEPDQESRQEAGQESGQEPGRVRGQEQEQGGGTEVVVKERGNVPPLVPSSDPLNNPKTRLGWGFWRN